MQGGDQQARRIFADAVAQRRGIAVFEPLNRSPLLIVLVFLQAIVRGLVLTPFIGRFSATRLLFTYVVPLGPLSIAWDGVVSCLRTYDADELRAVTTDLGGAGYTWKVGDLPEGGGRLPPPITCVLGIPAGDDVRPHHPRAGA